MVDVSPITQPIRDLINALNTVAFGPDPGPQYLIIRLKYPLAQAAGTTYEIDYTADSIMVIQPTP